jgi:hypothetical protein
VDLESHRLCVASIKHGKKLPDALYLFRPRNEDVSLDVWNMISRAEIAAKPDPSWNLLKIHAREVAMTFLTYSEFEVEPHPALAEATKINLNTGSAPAGRQSAHPPG